MEKFTAINSTTFVLQQTDIDTDQIIPARFLTTTVRQGLGKHAFADWRYTSDGELIADAPLNSAGAQSSDVLIAGNNFGCGSSREHAPWALLDFGFKVVISSQIADIFRSNSLKNGLLAIDIAADAHRYLLDNPAIDIAVDLKQQNIEVPGHSTIEFEIDGFARHCMLEGVDQLGYLLQQEDAIKRFEDAR